MLWIPGRPPLCSQDLLPNFRHIIQCLLEIVVTQSGEKLNELDCWITDAFHLVVVESEECLGTDEVLNAFHELLQATMPSAILYSRANMWPQLQELATHYVTVCDQLEEEWSKYHAPTTETQPAERSNNRPDTPTKSEQE